MPPRPPERPWRAAGVLAAVLAACVAEVPSDADPRDEHEYAEGCGGAMTDPDVYEALPLVTAPPATFSLTVLDIGQGDSAVIRTPSGCAALFDGGPSGAGTVIKSNLASLGITRLDAAFVSHYHADHLGSLDDVEQGADGVPIATVYDRGGSYTTNAYAQYAAQFAGRRVTATVGQVIELCGEVRLTVVTVGGNGVIADDENALSVAVKVSFGAFDALIGGDLTGFTPDIESLAAPSVGEIEVYRVHHHGSATSSNASLLSTLRPTVSLISLGANNIFGHPAPATMQHLAAVSSAVWLTENPATGLKLGSIVVTSATGATYQITQGAFIVEYHSKGIVDTGPPGAPTELAAVIAPTSVSLTWTASVDDLGVTGYLVYRDGALIAEPIAPGHVDTTASSGHAYTYEVAARDADGGISPRAALAVTTPCDARITARTWDASRNELTVGAICTRPTAVLHVTADGVALGSMLHAFGRFTFKRRLTARPACIEIDASCGDHDLRCF